MYTNALKNTTQLNKTETKTSPCCDPESDIKKSDGVLIKSSSHFRAISKASKSLASTCKKQHESRDDKWNVNYSSKPLWVHWIANEWRTINQYTVVYLCLSLAPFWVLRTSFASWALRHRPLIALVPFAICCWPRANHGVDLTWQEWTEQREILRLIVKFLGLKHSFHRTPRIEEIHPFVAPPVLP